MINVSKEFRETMKKRRDFKEFAKITFADGEVMEIGPESFTMQNQSLIDGAGASALPLGEAVEKSVQIELMNDEDQFSEYDFFGAKIQLMIKFQLSSSVEIINKGTYTVVTPETYGTVISITAVDDMYKADKNYDSTLTYPSTVGEILRDACSKCNIPLLTTTFANSDKEVQVKPEDTTYRQVIGYCAMFAAGNARIDVNGYLNIVPYDLSSFEKFDGLDGGVFDDNTPYASGDSADGGSFNPWNTGDSFDGGVFGDRDGVHILYSFKNLKTDTDDVVITGIQMTGKEDVIYSAGTEGYQFAVENPLFSGMEQEMINYLGSRLIGMKVRKFDGDHISDPTIEAFDLALVIDRKQNTYQTIITDVNFTVMGWTTVSNSAESAVRNSSKYYSEISKAIVQARRDTEEQISGYDLAVQQMTSIMANSLGMFQTVENTENGGHIVYQHNKPLLEDSDIIWKKSEAGFVVSTDGGKTWNAGIDAQGNAVLNVLSAVGINFDWAKGGSLTLGGANNQNGKLKVLDSSGNEVVTADRYGINVTGGTISGSLIVGTEIIGSSFRSVTNDEYTGILIEEASLYTFFPEKGNLGVQIYGSSINLYSWNTDGNYVGSLESVQKNDNNLIGVSLSADFWDYLSLGYKKESESATSYSSITINENGGGGIKFYTDVISDVNFTQNIWVDGRIYFKDAAGGYWHTIGTGKDHDIRIFWDGSNLNAWVDTTYVGNISLK